MSARYSADFVDAVLFAAAWYVAKEAAYAEGPERSTSARSRPNPDAPAIASSSMAVRWAADAP